MSRKTRTALLAVLLVCGMTGLSFAAVPLYRIFCQVTGFDGTPRRAENGEAQAATVRPVAGKTISIRFDANVARDLPWRFRPLQVTDTVTIGGRDMAIYTARNNSHRPVTGTATFNVEPSQAGKYFTKIQCFCFTEQTLQPGQEVRMPVLYYVDPAILSDPDTQGLEQITLSYTFHEARAAPETLPAPPLDRSDAAR